MYVLYGVQDLIILFEQKENDKKLHPKLERE